MKWNKKNPVGDKNLVLVYTSRGDFLLCWYKSGKGFYEYISESRVDDVVAWHRPEPPK